jgi:hypothetical protein
MLGTSREKAVAASITPAAAPKRLLNRFFDISVKNRAGRAPTPVARPARMLAKKPITTISPKIR